MAEFKAWPKTSRLDSPVVITEKLDGANGCVVIEEWDGREHEGTLVSTSSGIYDISAQSRTRIARPGQDETGIAVWVAQRAAKLVADLGPGFHYGEFVKGKGLTTPKFFLFNTGRWFEKRYDFATPELTVVPVLFEGDYREGLAEDYLNCLREHGSTVLGTPPEGIVIFWKHDQSIKKVYTGLLKKGK